MTIQQKESITSILNAALHNSEVVRNQVNSLQDDYPMPGIENRMNDVVDMLKTKLEELHDEETTD
jgi:hypothetical protein